MNPLPPRLPPTTFSHVIAKQGTITLITPSTTLITPSSSQFLTRVRYLCSDFSRVPVLEVQFSGIYVGVRK